MKVNQRLLKVSWAAIVVLATILITSAHAKTWTSADGSKTFTGDLTSYDAKSGSVKVTLSNGKQIEFNQKILSKADVTYLKENEEKSRSSSPKVTPIVANISKTPDKKKQKTISKTQGQNSYYREPPILYPHPKTNDKKPWSITNFGPVGIGINLTGSDFSMVISNIEEGSPADKARKLKVGQIIEV